MKTGFCFDYLNCGGEVEFNDDDTFEFEEGDAFRIAKCKKYGKLNTVYFNYSLNFYTEEATEDDKKDLWEGDE